MIHRLIARLIPGRGKAGAARVYGPKDHPLRQAQISPGALQVTRRLQEAGFNSEIDTKSDKDSDHRIQDPDGHWVDMAVKRRWPK